ncbi:hypothetical protein RUM44_007165 [Polyplax serrata]|uniref:Uncharacterized protein n=1 Tax=Polyplax serrata TaxID=468196 RepID=A0ABR1AZY0_POLSC
MSPRRGARKRDERTEEEAAKKRTQKEEESSLGQPDTEEWTWKSRSAKCTVAQPKASIFHDSESPMRVEINWKRVQQQQRFRRKKRTCRNCATEKRKHEGELSGFGHPQTSNGSDSSGSTGKMPTQKGPRWDGKSSTVGLEPTKKPRETTFLCRETSLWEKNTRVERPVPATGIVTGRKIISLAATPKATRLDVRRVPLRQKKDNRDNRKLEVAGVMRRRDQKRPTTPEKDKQKLDKLDQKKPNTPNKKEGKESSG